MKAVIIIDMPEDVTIEYAHANVEIYSREFKDGWQKRYRNTIIPLRPLPEKKKEIIVLKGHAGNIVEAYQQGWNNCIDAIFGEENVRR